MKHVLTFLALISICIQCGNTEDSTLKKESKLTSEVVSAIIERELNLHPEFASDYATELGDCLVTPRWEQYTDEKDSKVIYQLWTVLEENPGEPGYRICFDEDENIFGLGFKSSDGKLIFHTGYGSFIKTFKNM